MCQSYAMMEVLQYVIHRHFGGLAVNRVHAKSFLLSMRKTHSMGSVYQEEMKDRLFMSRIAVMLDGKTGLSSITPLSSRSTNCSLTEIPRDASNTMR